MVFEKQINVRIAYKFVSSAGLFFEFNTVLNLRAPGFCTGDT